MRMSHQKKVKLARQGMTKEELKRPRDIRGKRQRTSIWDSAFWEDRRLKIKLRAERNNSRKLGEEKSATGV